MIASACSLAMDPGSLHFDHIGMLTAHHESGVTGIGVVVAGDHRCGEGTGCLLRGGTVRPHEEVRMSGVGSGATQPVDSM